MTGKYPYWQHPMYDPYTYPEVSGIKQYEFFEGINDLSFAILRECRCIEDKVPCPREKFIYTFSDGSEEAFNFICSCLDPLCTGWKLTSMENKILKLSEYGFIDMGSGNYESETTLFKVRTGLYLLLYSNEVNTEPDFGDYYERNAPYLFEEKETFLDLPEEEQKRRYEEMEQSVREEFESIERDFEPIPQGDFVDGILIKATPEQLTEKFIEFMSYRFEHTLAILKLNVNMYGIPESLKFDDKMEFDFHPKVDSDISKALHKALDIDSLA